MPTRGDGFREARAGLIRALELGQFEFEIGEVREGKNLLQTGEVTREFVIGLLRVCRGSDHSTSPHHFAPSLSCHVFKPVAKRVRWYIKCYFPGATTVLISVHIAEH
ncbi:MAG: hypothetical protein HZA61_06815 [Candidatus Eisenbacteria bacterium]|uniref:Uncharacterized protein n=1 Tax=Eiseniibacteriota bacterium TaxID=2212470 RepID=A0A933W866_UNCEI|nr:hypothetical protein [Candidatus Eisenbacteria bacterium]